MLSSSVGRFKTCFRHTLSSGYTNVSLGSVDEMAAASANFQRGENREYAEQYLKHQLKSLFSGQSMKNDCFYKQQAFEIQQWGTERELRGDTAKNQKQHARVMTPLCRMNAEILFWNWTAHSLLQYGVCHGHMKTRLNRLDAITY